MVIKLQISPLNVIVSLLLVFIIPSNFFTNGFKRSMESVAIIGSCVANHVPRRSRGPTHLLRQPVSVARSAAIVPVVKKHIAWTVRRKLFKI